MDWTPEHITFSVSLLYTVTGFAAYYFLSASERPQQWIVSRFSRLDPQVVRIVLQRSWGLFFLGLVPLIIISAGYGASPARYGWQSYFLAPPPLWSILLMPLLVLISYLTSRTPGNLDKYPQIRTGTWTPGIVLLSAFSWILFLVGYEFLFRGFLLHASLELLNPVAAIALNVTLYAFAHLYKGPEETFGAIPLGVVLCTLTIVTGNIWSAVILHSVMALSNEWFSLRAQPHMKFTRS